MQIIAELGAWNHMRPVISNGLGYQLGSCLGTYWQHPLQDPFKRHSM